MARIGQIALVAAVAAVVALLVVFGKSLLGGGSPLNSDSETKQVSKPSDSPTANDVAANRTLVPAAGIAAAPGAAPRNCTGTSAALIGAGAASGALSDLETAWAGEQCQQYLSRGIPLLKRVGFLSSDGAPTQLYSKFRNADSRGAAMADALRAGYRERRV